MSKALYKCSLLYYLLKKAYSLSQGTCDDSLIWGGEQYTQVQILKSQLDCLPAIYTKRIFFIFLYFNFEIERYSALTGPGRRP